MAALASRSPVALSWYSVVDALRLEVPSRIKSHTPILTHRIDILGRAFLFLWPRIDCCTSAMLLTSFIEITATKKRFRERTLQQKLHCVNAQLLWEGNAHNMTKGIVTANNVGQKTVSRYICKVFCPKLLYRNRTKQLKTVSGCVFSNTDCQKVASSHGSFVEPLQHRGHVHNETILYKCSNYLTWFSLLEII